MTGTSPAVVSTGRADDAALLAAADLSEIAADPDVPYRPIGASAVTLLTAVHGVTDRVPSRETSDADVGAEHPVVADPRLLAALLRRGHHQSEGNRSTRTHTSPALDGGAELVRELVVDVLAPSSEGRPVTHQTHGGGWW